MADFLAASLPQSPSSGYPPPQQRLFHFLEMAIKYHYVPTTVCLSGSLGVWFLFCFFLKRKVYALYLFNQRGQRHTLKKKMKAGNSENLTPRLL